SQRRRAVLAGCRPRCVDGHHADFCCVMKQRHDSQWTAEHVGEVRSLVTPAAARLVAKEILARLSRVFTETSLRGPPRTEAQLVVEQRAKFRGDTTMRR